MRKEQEMFALIEEFENSSMSGTDFCKAKGMEPSTFYYWKKKKFQRNAPEGVGFMTISPKTETNGNLELIYPNGIRLKLDASQLPLIGKLLRLY